MNMSRHLDDALAELEVAARHVREALAGESAEPSTVHWARQMLSVLAELERQGGRVPQREFLRIGERFGYHRRGMAGFYQQLVSSERGETVLTDVGRERLRSLRTSYEPLVPRDLATAFPADTDPFVMHLRAVGSGSGDAYDAEDAKRELYRS